ncbi:MAG: NAD(P)H-dependent oxidoreductase subunit E [Dehalococcoidia bacterium]
MSAEPTLQEVRDLVSEFGPNKGHVLPALHKVQHEYGYVPRVAIEAIAVQLATTPALIYGALSFYADFRTSPPPKVRIAWCSGPACRLEGGDRIREAVQRTLGLPLGGQDADGKVGIEIGQCNGTCSEAPQVWVNGEVRGGLTVSSAIELARRLSSE